MSFNQYPYSYLYPQMPQMPQMQMPTFQQQPSQSVPQTPIVWVTSEDTVRNYPVAPGGSVLLMNENEPFMYMKTADQFGKSNIIKKRLVDETDDRESKVDLGDYIKREEIENIITDAVKNEVEKRISEISFKPTKKKPVVIDDED